MKNLIKALVPVSARPTLQKIYWKLMTRTPSSDFDEKQYDALSALKCTVAYNSYGGYCVPKSSQHRPAAQAILSSRVWEPKTIQFMLDNCGNGDIVHAGTFFGDFLPALSMGIKSGSKIWAFEPNRENYRCAYVTVAINNLENVELSNTGLGEKREQLVLKTIDGSGQSLGGASRIMKYDREELIDGARVQIVTIDESVPRDREVSIIQLDVEGYEKEALSGALEIIERCRPVIILEVLEESTLLNSEWFSTNILSLGYEKTGAVHANCAFSCKSKGV